MAVYSYAEQFEQALQQKYAKELTSYALEQSNPQVKFINAQTIKLVIWDLILEAYLMNGNQRN